MTPPDDGRAAPAGICLDLAENGLIVEQPDGRRTKGTPPILVERDAACGDCGRRHDMEKCPKCGSWIELSYGLMGGGLGAVKFCSNEKCNWMFKEFDCE